MLELNVVRESLLPEKFSYTDVKTNCCRRTCQSRYADVETKCCQRNYDMPVLKPIVRDSPIPIPRCWDQLLSENFWCTSVETNCCRGLTFSFLTNILVSNTFDATCCNLLFTLCVKYPITYTIIMSPPPDPVLLRHAPFTFNVMFLAFVVHLVLSMSTMHLDWSVNLLAVNQLNIDQSNIPFWLKALLVVWLNHMAIIRAACLRLSAKTWSLAQSLLPRSLLPSRKWQTHTPNPKSVEPSPWRTAQILQG